MWCPNLEARQLEPEKMDGLELDPVLHRHALNGIARLNAWSGTARSVFNPLSSFFNRSKGNTKWRVLDIATGAGDIPVRLFRRGRKSGNGLQVQGCDRSAVAVEHARRLAVQKKADVHFFQLDVLRDPLPETDIICSSLFLHHLTFDEAVHLLNKMRRTARRMIVIQDLRRSAGGWYLALAASFLLTRSRIVQEDAPQSVRAAFTLTEVRQLLDAAGLKDARLEKRWPFRFQIIWENPDAAHDG